MINPTHFLGFGRHEGFVCNRRVIVQRKERVFDRQVILAHEIQIALVVGRAAEDRAGAVIHQNEIGDPDGQLPVRV